MKFPLYRILSVALLSVFFACQDHSTSLSEGDRSDSVSVALRLTASNGGSIPEADSLRFHIRLSSRPGAFDTTVPWSRHELSLGTVPVGAQVTWKVEAFRTTDSTRTVVWASDTLKAQAVSQGVDQLMNLETPIASVDSVAPAITSMSRVPDATGSIGLDWNESDDRFSFELSESAKVTVLRNQSVWTSSGGGLYETILNVPAGASQVLRVSISDSVGNMVVRTWKFSRPLIDSTILATILSPNSSSTPFTDDSANVEVRVSAMLPIDSVVVAKTKLVRDVTDSSLWGAKIPLQMGTNDLIATAWAGKKSASSQQVAAERIAKPPAIDSSVSVNFVSPSRDTVVFNASASLAVSVKTTSLLTVDSVLLGGRKMAANNGQWTYSVASLKVGDTSLVAVAWASGRIRGRDTLKVTRLSDSGATVAFASPSRDTILSNVTTSLAVSVNTISAITIDSVLLGGKKMTGANGQWTYSVASLKVGDSTLVAAAWAAGKVRGQKTLKVSRLPDSSVTVSFSTPSRDTTVANVTTSISVIVKTSSALRVDSVLLGGRKMTSISGGWSYTVAGLKIGDTSLVAEAWSTGKARGQGALKVSRLSDSGVTVAFASPSKDTAVGFATTTLAVTVKSTSVLTVDSVLLAGQKMTFSNGSWTYSVTGLKVGDTSLVAVAWAAGKARASDTLNVQRPIDSTVTVTFISPSKDTSVSLGTASIALTVKASSILTVDSVLLEGKKMTSSNGNWTLSAVDLVPGDNLFYAVPWTMGKAGASAWVTIHRPVDSTVSASFVSPSKDTTVGFATMALSVTLKTTSVLTVDSVLLGGKKMTVANGNWTYAVTGLKVGDTSLVAVAWAAGKARARDTVVVRRPVDSAVSAVFSSPSKDTTVSFTATSLAVSVKTTSVLVVDSVRLNGTKMAGTNGIWSYTVTGLNVGDTSLVAEAWTMGTVRARDTVKVKRSIDSTVAVSLLVPSVTRSVPYDTATIPVSVKTASVLHIDSVFVGTAKLTRSADSTVWTGTSPLAVGQTALVPKAFEGTRSFSGTAISITRGLPSSDASLLRIDVSNGALSPVFAKNDTMYVLTLPIGKDTARLSPVKNETHATVSCTRTDAVTVAWPITVTDSVRLNCKVTAQDTTVKRVYSVKVVSSKGPLIKRMSPSADSTRLDSAYSSYEVKVKVTDPYALQYVRIKGLLATGVDSVYTRTVPLVNGWNAIQVNVLDEKGIAANDTMRIFVDLVNPVVAFSSPGRDTTLDSTAGAFVFTASVTDNIGVRTVKLNGVSATKQVGTNLWSAVIPTVPVDSIRIVATDSFGNQSEKTLNLKWAGRFTDSRDGASYLKVKIGNQVWMAENLNYSANDTGVCYNDDPNNCTAYGRLYTWDEAMGGTTTSAATPSGVRGICSEGWHVPSDAEWDTLLVAAGGATTAAPKLKSLSGWNSDSYSGTDDLGFRAMPSGYFYYTGTYSSAGYGGYWWSATQQSATYAWSRSMSYSYASVSRSNNDKSNNHYSLRCVQD